MFDRKKPCPTCPFRTGGRGLRKLGCRRAQEIADALLNDQTFTCHDDISRPEQDRQHCVGAMMLLEKQDRPNQIMRIGERIGIYNPDDLVGRDEVFDDLADWVECQAR